MVSPNANFKLETSALDWCAICASSIKKYSMKMSCLTTIEKKKRFFNNSATIFDDFAAMFDDFVAMFDDFAAIFNNFAAIFDDIQRFCGDILQFCGDI